MVANADLAIGLWPGPSVHTKARSLILKLPQTQTPARIAHVVSEEVEGYRQNYIRYFRRYESPGVTMLDPYPRVILVPGVGLFTTGKDRRAARITRDLSCHTMRFILRASAIDAYTTISPKELCDFEYWPLENFKLSLLPPEKQLSRRIALVSGAAGAIGRAIAARFVSEGGSVVLTDVDEPKLRALSNELNNESGEANTVAIPMHVSQAPSVMDGFRKAVLAYGGLDILVSNAGIERSAPVVCSRTKTGANPLSSTPQGIFWCVARRFRVFKNQGLGGNVVVVASKNALAPGKHFSPYSASKAAQAQLSRVLAIEGAEFGVRVNMVNPDAVFEGSGLWSPEIRQARAEAYGIPVETIQGYCVARSLLKVKVTAQDVAEAALFLASDRSAKTAGAIIPVDGGVREAFPR